MKRRKLVDVGRMLLEFTCHLAWYISPGEIHRGCPWTRAEGRRERAIPRKRDRLHVQRMEMWQDKAYVVEHVVIHGRTYAWPKWYYVTIYVGAHACVTSGNACASFRCCTRNRGDKTTRNPEKKEERNRETLLLLPFFFFIFLFFFLFYSSSLMESRLPFVELFRSDEWRMKIR